MRVRRNHLIWLRPHRRCRAGAQRAASVGDRDPARARRRPSSAGPGRRRGAGDMSGSRSRWTSAASTSSSGSTVISSGQPLGEEPIIKVDGNGQGCEGEVAHTPGSGCRNPRGLRGGTGSLQGLARFHDPRDTRNAPPDAGAPPACALAPDREHDDDRIDRVKWCAAIRERRVQLARGTLLGVPHCAQKRCRAANIEDRARLGQDRGLAPRSAQGQGADIDVLGCRIGRQVAPVASSTKGAPSRCLAGQWVRQPRSQPAMARPVPVERHLSAIADRGASNPGAG